MDYVFQSRGAAITKSDVQKLKRSLRIGDRVWIEIEAEVFVGDKLCKRTTYKKRKVVKKFPHVVEVQTGSTKRETLTYEDILVNDIKRKQKADERSLE